MQRMLATDLDGTFIGDDTAMLELWRDLEAHDILVVFSTGRHLQSIERFRRDVGAPSRPHACICMVGTEIWHRSGTDYRMDSTWQEHIDHGWDRAAIEQALMSVPGLRRQPDEWQSRHKSSWFLDPPTAHAAVARVESVIAEAGLGAKVIHSQDRFLDVLPPRSGKGGAVSFLADTLGIDAAHVVTAGDTGNDVDMMRPELGFRSIAVANSSPELQALRHDRLFHAGGDHALGIREGLVRFGWLPG